MRFLNSAAVLSVMLLAACAPPTPGTDAATTTDAAVCDSSNGHICSAPTSNLCSMEGCNFRALTLPDCENTPDYSFYNTDFQTADLTLVVVAAGWCVPCQMEAPQIERYITQGYSGRVRVVTVLGQNPDGSAPTKDFCNTWKNRYGLSSHMAIDPNGATQIYFPDMAFPANILIDRQGRIRYRKYGTSTGLADLRTNIDALLAEITP